jgi:hypothetical protein
MEEAAAYSLAEETHRPHASDIPEFCLIFHHPLPGQR